MVGYLLNEYFGVAEEFTPKGSGLEWYQKKGFKRVSKCQTLSSRQWKSVGGFQVVNKIMNLIFKPITPVDVTIKSLKNTKYI